MTQENPQPLGSQANLQTDIVSNLQQHAINNDLLIAYYEHQYARLEQMENQSMNLTNIVISISVLAFAFGYESGPSFSILSGVLLPILVILVNIFAIGYIQRTRDWASVHRARAKKLIASYGKELEEFEKIDAPKVTHRFPWVGMRTLQVYIHGLMSMASVIVALVYFYELLRNAQTP